MGRPWCLLSGVHEQEGAGAVGALGGPDREAALTDEGGLLVAGDSRDGDVEAEEDRRVGVRQRP